MADVGELRLGIAGFSYPDLYLPERLEALYQVWRAELESADAALAARYAAWRAAPDSLTPVALSSLLVEVAPHVSRFVARLFGVEEQWDARRRQVANELIVFRFKDQLVKRRAWKRTVEDPAAARRAGDAVLGKRGIAGAALDDEPIVAAIACQMLDEEAALKKRTADDPELVALRAELSALELWVMARKPALDKTWLSYRMPHPISNALELVKLRRPDEKLPEMCDGPPDHRRARDGFALTDRRMTPPEVLAQVDYCLYCHDRDKDSCSKGLHDVKTGALKPNALGVELAGCPLDEKISEMHLLERAGDSLDARALV